ncbi:MAG: helix-turn-helix domain-containing protein [Clostridiales bacterium]|nr:helix-turn-helix domain-containing protein [Candidatus Blautia equi]
MDTLMIVESAAGERKNLVRLIKESGIAIGEILECSSGGEALQLLKERSIDMIFAALALSDMDGCKLAEQAAKLRRPEAGRNPALVVFGETQDFRSAVELLKYGARDYILKPFSPEAVREVLTRMDLEICREKKSRLEVGKIYRQHVRTLLKSGEQENEEAWEILISAFEERRLEQQPYRLVLTNVSEKRFPGEALFFLDKVKGDLYFIEESQFEHWKNAHVPGFCIGISREHVSVGEISTAYREALEARGMAFIRNVNSEVFDDYIYPENDELVNEMEHFLQQFPAVNMEIARKRFRNLCFEARHKRISPLRFLNALEELDRRLSINYELISVENSGLACPKPMDCTNVDVFGQRVIEWLTECQRVLIDSNESSRKNEKLREAVRYIQENYQKDLDLAMVSNHISMNYSMFSNAFKIYTGVNFVNYLKDIRIREARKLLEHTNMKIAEVGAAVGYSNDKHFMKTFKAICGASPSEYRRAKELQKQNHISGKTVDTEKDVHGKETEYE